MLMTLNYRHSNIIGVSYINIDATELVATAAIAVT